MNQIDQYGSVSGMLPVLFSIGKISISSFGVFLALGFLIGVFLIWRLARAWDFDEEKILDLTLVTFLGGIIGARLYFVIENLQLFIQGPLRIILIIKYPGFSFWGAILGGWLTLYFFARAKKLDFWMIADIVAVGFLGGLILSDLGCLLGSCNVGIQSNSFFAVNMVGFLGKRFPTQFLEATLLFFILRSIWSSAVRFHQRGKIISLTLIYIALVKIFTEPLRVNHDEGLFLSIVLFILGITIFYRVSKRNLILDLKNFLLFVSKLISDPLTRKLTMDRVKKYWYNQKTSFSWNVRKFKKLLRRLHVRFS